MEKNPVFGIVTEYNPFHNGHKYQIDEAKKLYGDAAIISIMSPSFTQRGDLAITDKWTRASWAINNGVDLVFELPTVYALRSSEYFAKGAIESFIASGVITDLVFGCECTDHSLLLNLASEKISFQELKAHLALGLSYPAAKEKILLKRNSKYKEIIKEPNNILALEYLKVLKEFNSTIIPRPITRIGNNYNSSSLSGKLSSATAIRKIFSEKKNLSSLKKTVPLNIFEDLSLIKNFYNSQEIEERLYLLLKYKLEELSATEILKSIDVSEGLENKIKKAQTCASFSEMVNSIKSKRYPETRIKRLLLQLLISSPHSPSFKETKNFSPSYLRVLAFNDRGRNILKSMQKKSTLPIITKIGKDIFKNEQDENFKNTLNMEIKATNIFDLIIDSKKSYRDYLTSPIYKKP